MFLINENIPRDVCIRNNHHPHECHWGSHTIISYNMWEEEHTSWGIYGMQNTLSHFFNLIFALGMKWTTEFHFSAARMMEKYFFSTRKSSHKVYATQYLCYMHTHTHTFSLSLAYFFWEFSHNDKWYKIHQCQKILETVTLHFNTISLYELCCALTLTLLVIILFRGSACLNFSIKISFQSKNN